MAKKKSFSKWSQNICGFVVKKSIFSKRSQKTCFIPESWYLQWYEKPILVRSFLPNVDISVLLKVISRKRNFSRNVEIYGYFGRNKVFQRYLKKGSFSSTFEIFGDMGKKRCFQSDFKRLSFGGNLKTLACCGGAWKSEGWEAQL